MLHQMTIYISMQSSNKNIKDQRMARTARLKSKIQMINRQSIHFNQQYFEFPMPQQKTQAHQLNFSSINPTHTYSQKTVNPQQSDPRKESIKEKIKFRVKQELWNLLKKNFDKPMNNQPQLEQQISPKKQYYSQAMGYVKGKSFTRFTRDQMYPQKYWNLELSKKNESNRPRTQEPSLQRSNSKETKRKRIWSSVKMKQQDRQIIQRKEHKLSKSSYAISMLQNFNIQPWKAIQDHEQQFAS